jgi:hypothetical protein
MAKGKSEKERAAKAVEKARGVVVRGGVQGKKELGVLKNLNTRPSDRKNTRKYEVLKKAGAVKAEKLRYLSVANEKPSPVKYAVSRPDSDTYNLLAKRAKAKGLKGKEAKAAIEKAFKSTARTVKTERERSVTRAKGVVNRQSKKRKNTDLTR